MNRVLACGVSVFAVLAAGGVHAQEVAGQPDSAVPADGAQQSDAGSGADTGGLDTITVTAQRRSENLQNAAIAITAVGAEQLVRAGVSDTTQLTQVAPSLQVGSIAGSANTFYLRGVGNFTTNSLSDSAVSFNVDGVPFARSQAAHGAFYDLERVEVLKGPQGILYGRNSTGGAINVITAKPKIGEFGGYVQGEYGNFNAYKAIAAVNVPVGENSALRVSGTVAGRDGYYSDGTGDDDLKAVRAQFATRLGDSVRLSIGADYAYQGGVGPGSTIAGFDRSKRIGLLDPRADAVYASTYTFLAGNFLHPLPDAQFPPYNDNKFWGVYAQADIDTPVGTLTILPAFRQTKLNQRSYAPSFDYFDVMDSKQTSVEVRLASDKGRLVDYLLGAFYMNEDTEEFPIYNQQYFVGGGLFGSNTKSFAVFGQLTLNVSDRLRLTGGARYTIDRKKALLDVINLGVVCPASFVGGACLGTPAIREDQFPQIAYGPDGQLIPVQPWGPSGAILQASPNLITPDMTFKKPTFRVGVEFDAADQSLLYATFETGFKSGGYFSTIGNPVFQPETIDAFTIGSKNRFADNRIQLNVEGFYWIYKDQQVSHLSSNSLGGVEFITENVGRTKIWGFEVDARFRVAPRTTLSATAQYLNATYKDFVYFNPAATGVPTTGCPVSGPSAGLYRVDCSGRRSPNSPEWTLFGSVEQVIPAGNGEFVVNVDARYQSGTFTGFEQLPSQYQDGYAVVNAQVRYEFANPKVTISAFVNNLFDVDVSGFSLPNARAGAALVIESLRPPRTFGVRMRYDF